jgi:broad specificity phosphatase PhoE
MTENKLYLVRHGENLANLLVQLSYRKIDHPLTERGRLQAAQTADYFRDKTIHEVFASPLKRAVETAQAIAAPHGLAVAIRENFRELNTGDLEDDAGSEASWRVYHQVNRDWIDGKPESRFPGGEDYFMARDRMRKGVEEILDGKAGRAVVIVSHIGLMTAAIRDLCPRVDLDEILRKETQNCAITEIDMRWSEGRWAGELLRWSDFSHLYGEAANFVPALMPIK